VVLGAQETGQCGVRSEEMGEYCAESAGERESGVSEEDRDWAVWACDAAE
jgi:hypothetical protein